MVKFKIQMSKFFESCQSLNKSKSVSIFCGNSCCLMVGLLGFKAWRFDESLPPTVCPQEVMFVLNHICFFYLNQVLHISTESLQLLVTLCHGQSFLTFLKVLISHMPILEPGLELSRCATSPPPSMSISHSLLLVFGLFGPMPSLSVTVFLVSWLPPSHPSIVSLCPPSASVLSLPSSVCQQLYVSTPVWLCLWGVLCSSYFFLSFLGPIL